MELKKKLNKLVNGKVPLYTKNEFERVQEENRKLKERNRNLWEAVNTTTAALTVYAASIKKLTNPDEYVGMTDEIRKACINNSCESMLDKARQARDIMHEGFDMFY